MLATAAAASLARAQKIKSFSRAAAAAATVATVACRNIGSIRSSGSELQGCLKREKAVSARRFADAKREA
jgi:hypothetical protein